MSLAALLMGVAGRAAEVHRQKEERAYNEGLMGKHLTTQALLSRLEDPSLGDQERSAIANQIEGLYGMKPAGHLQEAFKLGTQVYPMIKMGQPQGQPMPPIPEMKAAPQGGLTGEMGQTLPQFQQLAPVPSAPEIQKRILSDVPMIRQQQMKDILQEQDIAKIKASSLSPEAQQAAIGAKLGVPSTWEAAQARAQEAERQARQQGPEKWFTVPGLEHPVPAIVNKYGIPLDPVTRMVMDFPDGTTPYVPARQPTPRPVPGTLNGKPAFGVFKNGKFYHPETDQELTRFAPSEPLYPTVGGGGAVYAPRSEAKGALVPKDVYSASGQPMTPGLGGGTFTKPTPAPGNIRTDLAAGVTTSKQLDRISAMLAKQGTWGPIAGWAIDTDVRKLGGAGLTPAQRQLAIQLRSLVVSRVAEQGGKVLTPMEFEVYSSLLPQPRDTYGSALDKLTAARQYLIGRLSDKFKSLTATERAQMPELLKDAGANERGDIVKVIKSQPFTDADGKQKIVIEVNGSKMKYPYDKAKANGWVK